MGYQLLNVLTFTLIGVVMVVFLVAVLGRILRPKAAPADEPAKGETYECGEPAVGSSWVRFDIRFYTVALIFLIFDVEVTFLYPWALVLQALETAKLGAFVFFEVLLFIGILGVGFVYCWVKGDLDWVKINRRQGFPAHRVAAAPPRPAAASEAAPREKAGAAT